MAKTKQTLPRHTNLAPQSRRIGAFLIDLGVLIAVALGFLFLCFQPILRGAITPYRDEFETEEYNSNLFDKDENGKIVKALDNDATVDEYVDVLSYYYLNYLTGNNIKENHEASKEKDKLVKLDDGSEVSRSEYYTVKWFNEEVLLIEEGNNESPFKYKEEGGSPNYNVIGEVNSTALIGDVTNLLQKAYTIANSNFRSQSYVFDVISKINFYYTLEFVLASLVSGIVTYLIFPIIFKDGKTLGKKLFKLGLANSDGYKFHNNQLLMRLMPFIVVDLALLIPIWFDIFFVLLTVIIVFLTSFAIAMASPKKTALHDFTARTIVIDAQTSIIFENEMEEDEYTKKEDGEEIEEKVYGEEPELTYEK